MAARSAFGWGFGYTRTKGGGYAALVNAYFERVTNGFRYGFSDLSKLYLTTAGVTNVSAGGESIGLALDRLRGDGRGVVNRLVNSRFLGAVSGSPGTFPTGWGNLAPAGTMTYASAGGSGNGSMRIVTSTQRYILTQSFAVLADTTYTVSSMINATTSHGVSQLITWTSPPAGATIAYYIDGVLAPTGNEATGTGVHMIEARMIVAGTAGTPQLRYGLGCQANITGDVTLYNPQYEIGAGRSTHQPTGLVLGGPGNHANQATGGSLGSYQATGILRVVTDDGYSTGLLPGRMIMARAKLTGGLGTRAVAGASGSATARFNLYFNSSGAAACRVGDGSEITAGGDLTDVDGTIGMRRRADDTIDLVINGEVAASAAMSGSPTTTHALALGAINNNGSLSSFFAGDFNTGSNGEAVLAGDAAPTDAELRAIHRYLMAA